MHKIEAIREKIDALDRELLSLFLARMNESKNVAEIKMESGASVYAPERERELLSEILKNVPEECKGYAKSLFVTLMRLSRLYQYTIMVERGAFPKF
jgi:chorismate mutase/prephenate dehydratase